VYTQPQQWLAEVKATIGQWSSSANAKSRCTVSCGLTAEWWSSADMVGIKKAAWLFSTGVDRPIAPFRVGERRARKATGYLCNRPRSLSAGMASPWYRGASRRHSASSRPDLKAAGRSKRLFQAVHCHERRPGQDRGSDHCQKRLDGWPCWFCHGASSEVPGKAMTESVKV